MPTEKIVIARITGEGFSSILTRDREWKDETKKELTFERVSYVSDFDINVDGANGQRGKDVAYANPLKLRGREKLANGGMAFRDGRVIGVASWYADIVATDAHGNPLTLDSGIVVSMAAYRLRGPDGKRLPASSPDAYVDPESVPCVTVPPVVVKRTAGRVLGCLAICSYGGKRVQAIVNDLGPHNKNGEGSPELARRLGIEDSPINGGIDTPDVLVEIYPETVATIDGVTYRLESYGA
jgi:hypothetical protein